MNMKDWYVLIVEDDPDGQEVIQRILRYHGIQFDYAMDAESALELLKEHPYTMAVLDLALPAMDGWGLLKRIKAEPTTAHIKCFAMTAFHSSEVAMEAIMNGFSAYFPKPLDPASLVPEMERILKAS